MPGTFGNRWQATSRAIPFAGIGLPPLPPGRLAKISDCTSNRIYGPRPSGRNWSRSNPGTWISCTRFRECRLWMAQKMGVQDDRDRCLPLLEESRTELDRIMSAEPRRPGLKEAIGPDMLLSRRNVRVFVCGQGACPSGANLTSTTTFWRKAATTTSWATFIWQFLVPGSSKGNRPIATISRPSHSWNNPAAVSFARKARARERLAAGTTS